MRKKIKNFIMSLLCLALFAVSTAPTFTPAFSSAPPSVEDGTSGDDVIAAGVNALNTLTGKMTAVSMALFPLALILIATLLLVTHDPKKVAGLLWIAGIVCGASLIVILANNGTALELIKQLASFVSAS